MVMISSRSSASNAAFKMAFRYASPEFIFLISVSVSLYHFKLKVKEKKYFLKIKTILLKNAICATDKSYKQQD